MTKAVGVLCVFAGLALAAYAAYPAKERVGSGFDDFSLKLAALPPALPRSENAAPRVAEPSPSASPVIRGAVSAGGLEPAKTKTAVVTVSEHHRFAMPVPSSAGAQKSTLPTDRTYLARELQRELKRVGCYEGEVNGGWTTSTRKAMKAFTDRVNASLPLDEPDFVLLALVKGQSDKVCGLRCSAGESLTEQGRCVPSAILSQAGRPGSPVAGRNFARDASPPAIGGWSTTASSAPLSSTPIEGRMALAGPETGATAAGGPELAQPQSLARQPDAGSFPAANAEMRAPAAPAPKVSQRFDARSFFKRLDRQSAN